jgi:lysophospholipase L1-like esterase
MYDVYNRQADIVMVGTSLTRYADWQELLPNETVANRGIGSDISAGILNRLPQVIKLKPKICFVEVGINDIVSEVPEVEIKQNIKSIIDELRKEGIKPVLSNVIHVNASFPNSKKVNTHIKDLNSYIDGLGTDVLNLNPVLAPNGELLNEYDLYDGIHLSPAAYKIWADSVVKIIAQH